MWDSLLGSDLGAGLEPRQRLSSPHMAGKRAKRPRARRARQPAWAAWSDERLLEVRFCELGLQVEGTEIEARVERLYGELERRGLRFRPHVWLSTEWFSPDGVPGVAVPFFLAHPRLKQLERTQFLEVEGGTEEECMRLLRHECGHAIDTAYHLGRKRQWREHFGSPSEPYLQAYTPKPYSKRFVVNLERWYAQSHPSEDFAETFAVWLRPRSDWRTRYATWRGAKKKLEYVEGLMAEIAQKPQAVRCRERTESLAKLRTTLGDYYREKRERYAGEPREDYDRDLRRLFPEAEEAGASGRSAAQLLRRARPELRRAIARWTGQYRYTIDVVLEEMIERCEELGLRVFRAEEEALSDLTVMVTVQTMNHIHGGHHQVAR